MLGPTCTFWAPRCLHVGLGDPGLANSLLPALSSACWDSQATKLNLPAPGSQGTRSTWPFALPLSLLPAGGGPGPRPHQPGPLGEKQRCVQAHGSPLSIACS